jgi:hypothetical protein
MGSELIRKLLLLNLLASPMTGPMTMELYVMDPVNGAIQQMEATITLTQQNVRMACTTNQNAMTFTLVPIVNLNVRAPIVKVVKIHLAAFVKKYTIVLTMRNTAIALHTWNLIVRTQMELNGVS